MDTKGWVQGTHPALEGVRGAGRAQQLLELQGAVGHKVVVAQGRLVEDSQLEVATVGDVGAKFLVVRGFVGLLLGARLAHAYLVHAHRQVGVQQLIALLEERVAQGPAGGLQPHGLANADPQVAIELHGAGRHAGAAVPDQGPRGLAAGERGALVQASPRGGRRSGGSSREMRSPSPRRPAILPPAPDLPSPPSLPLSLPREVERRGAGRQALRGPGSPDRPSRASRGLARNSPLLQGREAPLPGEPERPVRLARASSVSCPRLLPLLLLPPPPRAHALPHSVSFKPGSSCRPIPGRSLAPPGSKFMATLRGAGAPSEARGRGARPAPDPAFGQ